MMDEQTINQMFELIHANMCTLMPTENTKEQDYKLWRQAFDEGLQNGMKHIPYHRDSDLKGYISYVVSDADSTVHLCEFQICPQYQRNSVAFRVLFSRFLREIKDCAANAVRTYANDRNPVSQSLIEKLGFEPEEKTRNGKRYVVSKESLIKCLSRLVESRPV